MELKVPGDPDISPDGRRVTFTLSETDWDDNSVVTHIHIQRVNAKPGRDEPRQVTRGKSNESLPRFSPDNARWVAFLRNPVDSGDQDKDGDEEERRQQVWRLPMDGGEAEPWTEAPEGVAVYSWLPDGAGIAYLAREPRPRPLQTRYERMQEEELDAVVEREEKFRMQIWTIDQDKKPTLVHPGDYGIGEIAVSPDGKRIAFSTNYTGEPNDYHKVDIWVVEVATGKTTQLTDGPGGKYHPRWSPDGKRIAYLRSLDPELSYSQENVFTVDAISGGESILATGDFQHDITGWPGFEWSPEGNFLIQAAVGTSTHLYEWDGHKSTEIIGGDGHLHVFRISNGSISAVLSNADQPPELYINGKAITALNAKWRESHLFAKTETIRWKSTDGLEVEGLLTLPPEGKRPFPTILSIHGGPYGRSVRALSPYTVSQAYAARGYAVFSPNFRGSEGYGDEFGRMNQQDLGGGDYRDIMSGVDFIIKAGHADPDRLVVTGGSYGGYMTNWVIGHTNRFKAAVSKFGIFSLITDFSNSEAPRWEEEYLGGFYWEHMDRYLAQSPMSYLSHIHTPVLIMHGEGDPNTFISNSKEMYTALKSLGRTVEYVHYPREGHGFNEPNHRLDECRRTLAWFDKYVHGESKHPSLGDKVQNASGWELMVTSARAGMKYAGRPAPPSDSQLLEVVFVLRDAKESRARLTLRARDVRLGPHPQPLPRSAGEGSIGSGSQLSGSPSPVSTGEGDRGWGPLSPLGFPIDALGETVLAEAKNWSFSFAPPKKDKNVRGIAVPLALVFEAPKAAETFMLKIAGFPPVLLEPAPSEDSQDEEEE